MNAIVSSSTKADPQGDVDKPHVVYNCDKFSAYSKLAQNEAILDQARSMGPGCVSELLSCAKQELHQRVVFEQILSNAHLALGKMYDQAHVDLMGGDVTVYVRQLHPMLFENRFFPVTVRPNRVGSGLYVDLVMDHNTVDLQHPKHFGKLGSMLVKAMAPYYEQRHAENAHRAAVETTLQQPLLPLLPPPDKRGNTRQPVSRVLSQQ